MCESGYVKMGTVLTKERAHEIVKQCQALATCGPWCDYLDKVMTLDERAQVNAKWDTMPGHTNFVDALNTFCRGK